VLDNLIAARSAGDGGHLHPERRRGRAGHERGLEYDTMSALYGEWVENEVLPLVEAQAHVRLTHDPDGRAAMGGSSGGRFR